MPVRHVIVRVGPADSPVEVFGGIKGRTSRALRADSGWLCRQQVLRSWTSVAASVGYVSAATVRGYVVCRYTGHEWDAA